MCSQNGAAQGSVRFRATHIAGIVFRGVATREYTRLDDSKSVHCRHEHPSEAMACGMEQRWSWWWRRRKTLTCGSDLGCTTWDREDGVAEDNEHTFYDTTVGFRGMWKTYVVPPYCNQICGKIQSFLDYRSHL